MAIQPSRKMVCAIAESGVSNPVYHTLSHLELSRLAFEQNLARADHVGDGVFTKKLSAGTLQMTLLLEGFSDDSVAEQVLMQAVLQQKTCLLRLDDAQGNRYEAAFRAARLVREAEGRNQERLLVELHSDGVLILS